MNLTTKFQRQRGHIAEGNAGLLSLLGLVVVISTIWYLGGKDEEPAIELHQSIADLAGSSTKTIQLQLPRDGLLVVDLDVKSGPSLNAYLARQGAPADKAGPSQVVEHFTAKQVAEYRRSARLERGNYILNLANSSPASETPAARVRISVRLRPRRRARGRRDGYALGEPENTKPAVANVTNGALSIP